MVRHTVPLLIVFRSVGPMDFRNASMLSRSLQGVCGPITIVSLVSQTYLMA